MKRVLLGAAVAVLAMAFAAPAMAATSDDPGGFLEICKAADTSAPVTGPFTFTVSEGGATVATQTVTTGTCSAPFAVPAGTATVTETAVPFATVTAIRTIPADRLISSNPGTPPNSGPNGNAVVTVVPGDISTTTTVTFTNKEVTGFIEVCKQAATGSGLTGTFQFTISGAMGFSDTVSVPVGACSSSIQVPAGSVIVQETGSPATFVTSITVSPSSALESTAVAGFSPNPDVTNGRVAVAVAAGDVSSETIVTFTNSNAVLKICKVAGTNSLGSIPVGENFPFTANGTSVTVPAGPPPGGTCEIVPGIFRAGTTVALAEGIVPGTQVSSITVAPGDREVPAGNANLTARTVTVVLGSGETVVTYTNVPAPPGTLKICKVAGPGVAAGALFTFTVAGLSGTTSVPAGSCVIVGPFPFNSTQTITESVPSGFKVTSIAADPSNRLVSSTATSGTVLVGTGVTEILFTDAAAGATGTPAPGAPGASNPTGGSSGTTSGTGTRGGTGTTGATSTSGVAGAQSRGHVTYLHLIRRNGRYYLQLKVVAQGKTAKVRLSELSRKGKLLRRVTFSVATGRMQTVRIPYSIGTRSLKIAVVS
jgi:hypothetical protein